jgi:hypothetical protein
MTEETREEGLPDGSREEKESTARDYRRSIDGGSIYVGNAALYFFSSMSEIR